MQALCSAATHNAGVRSKASRFSRPVLTQRGHRKLVTPHTLSTLASALWLPFSPELKHGIKKSIVSKQVERGTTGLCCCHTTGWWSLRLQGPSTTHLLLGGHLSCDQQPEEALRQRLRPAGSFRQQLLTLWYAVAPEADALWIEREREKKKTRYSCQFESHKVWFSAIVLKTIQSLATFQSKQQGSQKQENKFTGKQFLFDNLTNIKLLNKLKHESTIMESPRHLPNIVQQMQE